MLILVTVRRNEIRAVRRAVYRNFALGAATDGADFLALGGAESFGLAFFTDRAAQSASHRQTQTSSVLPRNENPKLPYAKNR
jgi:hypothetical protein